MARKINVYSAEVVVWAGEQFEWVMTSAEGTAVTVQQGSNPWPLSQTSYSVTPGTPVSAAVAANAALGSTVFNTNPPAPNVTQQIITVAGWAGDVCGSPSVYPGQYIIWTNANTSDISIKPTSGNTNFWPLPGQEHLVPKSGWLVVLVPANAAPGSYPLTVTAQGGSSPFCPQDSQPVIKVNSGR
jgi:hypothetical protein